MWMSTGIKGLEIWRFLLSSERTQASKKAPKNTRLVLLNGFFWHNINLFINVAQWVEVSNKMRRTQLHLSKPLRNPTTTLTPTLRRKRSKSLMKSSPTQGFLSKPCGSSLVLDGSCPSPTSTQATLKLTCSLVSLPSTSWSGCWCGPQCSAWSSKGWLPDLEWWLASTWLKWPMIPIPKVTASLLWQVLSFLWQDWPSFSAKGHLVDHGGDCHHRLGHARSHWYCHCHLLALEQGYSTLGRLPDHHCRHFHFPLSW